jgi:ribosome biogenesis GTPase
MAELEELGWSAWHAQRAPREAAQGRWLGRVAAQARGAYRVLTVQGGIWREWPARVTGHLLHEAEAEPAAWPVVGDWVQCRAADTEWASIGAVLPRRTLLLRRAAGDEAGVRAGQPIAANVDVVFVCETLERPLRPARIGRLLAAAWGSGARPVVLLTKADLAPGAGGVEAALSTAAAAAPGVSVHAVSARDGAGLAPLAPYLGAGATAVLVGPSGAGKSTLVNALLGAAVQPVGAVREADGKGRHTTTARDLLRLPGGALLIDSPGVREFGLAADASDLEGSHGDVAALAAQCRFRDCRHEGEPGCAVAAAVEAGRLGAERLAGFRKLARESGYHERRDDPRRAREHERAVARLHARIQRESRDRKR